ncbi:MAG: hypothetical protein AB7S69_03700 [Salinivirgaceae bacterium]|jgi:hypothetical protein
MKTELKFKEELKPFLDMVKTAKSENNSEFLENVEEFKDLLIAKNICGIQENPLLLDKFIDEIIEQD